MAWARRYPVVDEGVHFAGLLLRDVLFDIETVDGSAEMNAERLDLEMRYPLDAALAGNNAFPAAGDIQSHWCDKAKTRYDNPSFRHLGEPLWTGY